MTRPVRTAALLVAVAAVIGAVACRGSDEASTAAPAPAASALPVDRLAPGELRPSAESAFGLALPEHMSILARYPDKIVAAGAISPEHVANFVRDRVVVSRVELGAARTIFPLAKIRGGDAQRTYQIEIAEGGKNRTVLEVRDVTPPQKTEGLSDEQRLKQVGLRPDGKLLDRAKLE